MPRKVDLQPLTHFNVSCAMSMALHRSDITAVVIDEKEVWAPDAMEGLALSFLESFKELDWCPVDTEAHIHPIRRNEYA